MKLTRRRFLRHLGIAGIFASQTAPKLMSAPLGNPTSVAWTPEKIVFASAKNLAKAIRAKEISAQETVQTCLDRIDSLNPKLNAICQIARDSALQTAREADQELASLKPSSTIGPLHGVPITIKDSLDTQGIISSGGTLGRKNFIPEEDATVVHRLRSAGAILLGKSNTPELTLSYKTDNLVYGRTNNPYDLARTPGGSSGGAAASVATGCSALDLGSDTAGSIRVPSHFCGITGIKPTSGRVSRYGHIIPPGGPIGTWTQIGPMARRVEDLILTLPIISGIDPKDPEVVPTILGDPNKVPLKKLRAFFFTRAPGHPPPIPEITQAVLEASILLDQSGISIEEKNLPRLQDAITTSATLTFGDGGVFYSNLLKKYGTTQPHADLATILKFAKTRIISPRTYSENLVRWMEIRQEMLEFMQDYDILLCPVCSSAAPLHHVLDETDYSYSFLFNFVGWPSAVVRISQTASQLPIGIQIVGRPWMEHQVLAVALHLEAAFGGWKPDFPSLT